MPKLATAFIKAAPKPVNPYGVCAIDVETTGDNPEEHDIVQVCFLPLDQYFRPRQDIVPFCMYLKPLRPENANIKAMKVNGLSITELVKHGVDPHNAVPLLLEYLEQKLFCVPDYKRVMPLAHNWQFDARFLREWMGQFTFSSYIDGRSRDTMTAAHFLNDQADLRREPRPFGALNLRQVALKLGIRSERKAHDALSDCHVTAAIYQKLMYLSFNPLLNGLAYEEELLTTDPTGNSESASSALEQ